MRVQSRCRPRREEGAYRAYVTDEHQRAAWRGPGHAPRGFFDSLLATDGPEGILARQGNRVPLGCVPT